ncbi:cyclin-P4-1-like [Triticum urartu]|uniref:Cyclin n=1 Tax=Triticum urartu TaxID=4572 RepID=A0A8R7K110_TRIUA|nr:cyclin-P4-1-like [Triticum urartu]XP_048553467.1 cyclin-P4-1-like [Triticum urartu]
MMTMAAEDQAAVPRVVSILSALLERVAKRNDVVAAVERRIRDVEEQEEQEDQGEDGKETTTTTTTKKTAVSAFQGLTKPAISVGGYLERIFRFAGCSPSCYVVAYIYLDRFLRRRPALAVDSFNVHRLLITSVLTAVKFVDDICYNNAYFARVGGISLMEMNYLEVDFLFGIAFDLNVTPAVFASYCAVLQTEMAYLEHPPPSIDAVSPTSLLQHCLPDQEVDTAAAAAAAAKSGCHRHQQQLTV